MTLSKIQVGISSCLIGEKVRFDGGHKQNRYIMDTLGQFFEFKPFCPEVAIGLGVPRPTLRLIKDENRIEAVGVKKEGLNVTDQLIEIAHEQSTWHQTVFGYIVKKGSPSCGMERVKVYKNGNPTDKSAGLYTSTMMQNFPNLPIEEEGRLGDMVLRENFIQRVFVYKRWGDLIVSGIDKAGLTQFHGRHKLILFSHNQQMARKLGKELSQYNGDITEYANFYISQLMEILKITATTGNHVNVLEHIRGYLKQDLDKGDKLELSESIENYRLGLLPLIVPITLLKHHFRKHPDPYIDQSFYMQPHPAELMLFNHL
jgi:uncharacterized protein YbgA (DUF1722 family)/uncharacterized protein YbbK (DUF523 family)